MLKYISMHIKSQLEYKSSFIFLVIAQLIAFGVYCVVFYSLFDKFGIVKSFNIYQVILCFSVVQFGESFAEGLLRGFDKFSEIIKYGHLDQLLVRPQNIYLQVIGYKVELSKFVKCIISLILLVYAYIKLQISVVHIGTVILMLLGSSIVFGSVLIIGAALCFVTIEGLEVINSFEEDCLLPTKFIVRNIDDVYFEQLDKDICEINPTSVKKWSALSLPVTL